MVTLVVTAALSTACSGSSAERSGAPAPTVEDTPLQPTPSNSPLDCEPNMMARSSSVNARWSARPTSRRASRRRKTASASSCASRRLLLRRLPEWRGIDGECCPPSWRAGRRSGGWLARGRRGVGGRSMRWPRFRCRWTRASGCRAPEGERPRRDVSRVGTAGGRERVPFWLWPTVVAADRRVGNNGAASRQSPSLATTSVRSASLARRLRSS